MPGLEASHHICVYHPGPGQATHVGAKVGQKPTGDSDRFASGLSDHGPKEPGLGNFQSLALRVTVYAEIRDKPTDHAAHSRPQRITPALQRRELHNQYALCLYKINLVVFFTGV